MHHLTPDEIERYASRSGSVDEILAVAEHFEVCADCRDRAAAILDPGIGEITHVRAKRRISGPHQALAAITNRRLGGRPLLLWALALGAIALVVACYLLYR